MNDKLKKKVEQAIRLLQSIKGDQLELSYSGGKDSDVILELAKMAGIKYRAIYKNTTIDPPGTIKHVREKGVEVVQPKETFAELIRKKGFPSRYRRFCCSELKEYPILNKSIQGIRRSESKKREKRYMEPSACRDYGNRGRVEIWFPILEWTDEDIKEFVDLYRVKCHPLYYDEKGVFHPERRLGCMCCPLASRKKRIKEFMKYPRMVKFYISNGDKYLENHRESKTSKRFESVYEWFCAGLFTDNMDEFNMKFKGLFPVDCKVFLENMFDLKL